jgi:hypothetical protein
MKKQKLKKLASFGYAARGTLYVIIGGLALLDGLGMGGSSTGSKGALRTIADQPFGKILLAVMTVGLIGYAGWRAIQAIFDADNYGTDGKGLAIRGGLLVSSITHASLSVWTTSLILTGSGSGSGQGSGWQSSSWASYVYLAIGIAVIGAGISFVIKGLKEKFKEHMTLPKSWMVTVSKAGLVARGIVWFVMGGLFLDAFWGSRGENMKGVGDTLHQIESSTFGSILLIVVSVGLILFGVYSFLQSKFREISVRD